MLNLSPHTLKDEAKAQEWLDIFDDGKDDDPFDAMTR